MLSTRLAYSSRSFRCRATQRLGEHTSSYMRERHGIIGLMLQGNNFGVNRWPLILPDPGRGGRDTPDNARAAACSHRWNRNIQTAPLTRWLLVPAPPQREHVKRTFLNGTDRTF